MRVPVLLNPIWKRVARYLTKECRRCGQTRLHTIFDIHITGKKTDCIGCFTAYQITHLLINYIFKKTNLTKEDVKKLMADQLIRQSMLNVVRGISHFGLRIPQPTAVPVVIVWNYTNRCNLNCLHCHQNSGEAGKRELTTEEVLKVIDKLGEAGLSILTFSGGEPLLRPDIYVAIERAEDIGIFCTIASNGTLMTKSVVHKLKDAGIEEDRFEIRVVEKVKNIAKTIIEKAVNEDFGTLVIGRSGISKSIFMGSVSRSIIKRSSNRAIWIVS